MMKASFSSFIFECLVNVPTRVNLFKFLSIIFPQSQNQFSSVCNTISVRYPAEWEDQDENKSPTDEVHKKMKSFQFKIRTWIVQWMYVCAQHPDDDTNPGFLSCNVKSRGENTNYHLIGILDKWKLKRCINTFSQTTPRGGNLQLFLLLFVLLKLFLNHILSQHDTFQGHKE